MHHDTSANPLILIFIFGLIGVIAVIKWINHKFHDVIVYSFQRGLHYKDGKLVAVLEAGRYKIDRKRETITPVEMRDQVLHVVNQELICADSFSIRLSASVVYQVTDAQKAFAETRNPSELLYLDTQLIMRELIAGMKVEEVVAQRNDISQKLHDELKPRGAAIGIAILRAGVRDITMPADVKKIYTQVAAAEKAAQAQLAKSRAETASLRALANAAKLIETNPNLLALRSLQSISELTASTGNTIVLGVPSPMVPIGSSSAPHPTGGAAPDPADLP